MKKFIIGIDEAGRGAVAGPIVAAAILSRGLDFELEILSQVKDSKQLSPKKREQLFSSLKDNFIWAVSVINNQQIDKRGIQTANCLVAERALKKVSRQLKKSPSQIVADYIGGAHKYIKDSQIEFYKKGESKFVEIAAASILAKVYRDRLMSRLHKQYKEYNFGQHKGYGTKQHLQIICQKGVCTIHRQSFLQKYLDK